MVNLARVLTARGKKLLVLACLAILLALGVGFFLLHSRELLGELLGSAGVRLDRRVERCPLTLDARDRGLLLRELLPRLGGLFEHRGTGFGRPAHRLLDLGKTRLVRLDRVAFLSLALREFLKAEVHLLTLGRVGFEAAVGLLDRRLGHLDALCGALGVVLGGLALRFDPADRLVEFVTRHLGVLLLGFELLDAGLRFLALGFQIGQLARQAGQALAQIVVLVERERHADRAVLVVERLETLGLGGLSFHDPQAPLGVLELLAGLGQVHLGLVELARCLDPALLVPRDARGFLEDRPALLRAGQQHRVDLALLDDRVGVGPDARVEEQLADVAESHPLVVNQVLARAVAVEAALDKDLVGLDRQAPAAASRAALLAPRLGILVALVFLERVAQGQFDQFGVGVDDRVVEPERHRGQARGGASGRAGEDDVDHLLAAEGFARPLAQHPFDGIDDIGLAAAVGPDNARDVVVKGELGAVREGLETVEDKFG